MKREWKQRWLEWLRDPANKQTKGKLHKDGGFCCLGGLCHISRVGSWCLIHDGIEVYKTSTETAYDFLPNKVCDLTGLPRMNGIGDVKLLIDRISDKAILAKINDSADDDRLTIRTESTGHQFVYASDLNDNGFNFLEIAQCIEDCVPEE